jgi:hypothetical protein
MERLIFMFGCLVGAITEAHMKLAIPAILITALVVASPTAFAQQRMDYKGTSSNPATSVSKDETTSMTKKSKKRMTSAKKKSTKPQTTGSGSSSPK